MNFGELLQGISAKSLPVTGIEHDSRRVRPGVVFVCISGRRFDGHSFAEQAVVAGASFVVGERYLSLPNYVQVENSRRALAELAYAYYGDHSQRLQPIGITGTNGKSTTCHLIASLLNQGGVPTATIGTLGVFFPEDRRIETTVNTTPDAVELARIFSRLQEQGAQRVALEVSSQATDQERVWGINFAGIIFTNLTQDHLDYHKTFEAYFEAKRRLFLLPHRQTVINIDDPYGQRLAAEFPGGYTISLRQPARIQAHKVDVTEEGMSFVLHIDGRTEPVAMPLHGIYNLYNLLSALGGIACLDLDPFDFLEGVSNLTLPKGRWEVVGQSPTVIVDYAHTPDSMEQVLSHARRIARGRVITLFGCTGNRDREKRPLMGEVASRHSEFVILSNDNPEGEDPEAIAKEALVGISKPHLVELDREKAIAAAIEMANPDDVVLILGKGHEETIDFGQHSLPFSDVAVARRYWEQKCKSL